MAIVTLQVTTGRQASLEDITDRVREVVRRSGVAEGTCTVYVPHATAGVLINESYDPTVAADILAALDRLVPAQGVYRHLEGNSPAHIKASLVGSSQTLLVQGGDLVLGTWQGIFLAEFDGPRQRRVLVSVRP
ncbi:MAG: secondary thiamine-phosphate synthase enzyme YjbQ [Anaerolineae bacterium]|nr:secondary thiamine-phosphate synthase enzyme YjbQ [Anaerolineae bacterium]